MVANPNNKPWWRKTVIIAAFITAIAAIVAAVIMAPNPIWCGVFPCKPKAPERLIVSVIDAQQAPVVGAVVQLTTDRGVLQQVSDSNGTVTMTGFADLDLLKLVVEKEGYEIYVQQLPLRIDSLITVLLSPARGTRHKALLRVRDQETGQPTPNVEVTVFQGVDKRISVTDSGGVAEFSLEFPSSEKLDVSVMVQAKAYQIKQENLTLMMDTLQDLVLDQAENSLKIEEVQPLQPMAAGATSELDANDSGAKNDETVTKQVISSDRVDVESGFTISTEPAPEANHRGEIQFRWLSPDNQALSRITTRIFTEKTDVNGQPLLDRQVNFVTTDESGVASQVINPGQYAISPELYGYSWDTLMYQHTVEADQRLIFTIVPAQIQVVIRKADGSLMTDGYVNLYTQKKDANGQSVYDQKLGYQQITDSGEVRFTVTPGDYAFQIDGLHGEDWGQMDHELRPATLTVCEIHLGRVTVEARDGEGQIVKGYGVEVRKVKVDANGHSVPGDQIVWTQTDNTGMAVFDLTPGNYILESNQGDLLVQVKPGEAMVVKNDAFQKP